MEEALDMHLRCELQGHEDDVRCLCACELGLLTGSRDKTIKLWREEPGAQGFALVATLVGHTDFVTALAYLPPGAAPAFPRGAIVSGSRDTTVVLWDPETYQPLETLRGHQYQVTGVAVTGSGDVVSSSMDKTLRAWRAGECVAVMEGHEAAVLCLVVLPGGEVASGSGDCTIRVWADYKCTHTIAAHSDSVRGLALVPGVGVVSASHDMTLKLWTLEGECLAELVGHTAIIYAAAAAGSSGPLASGSEDNTARLWRLDGACLQTLPHPGNIWGVEFLPSGDLVTACSDAVARVWTADPARASPEAAAAFEAGMAAVKAAADAAAAGSGSAGGGGGEGAMGGLPPGLKLEPASVLLAPGERDGKIVVVAEEGVAMAYAWDAAKGEWEKVGEVTDGPGAGDTLGTGASKWHAGQLWDFVMDVDTADGELPRKLALNAGDNPYDVADRFIEAESLPTSYREQIVAFILQNTGGAVSAGPSYNADPLTGGSAYVPPSAAAPRPGGSGGGGAAPMDVTGGGVDPFTGGRASSHLPATAFLLFEAVPGQEGMRRKLAELSAGLAAGGGEGAALALPEADLAAGGGLDDLMVRAAEAAGRAGSASNAELALLARLLSWPAGGLFPALDLARLLVLQPGTAERLAGAAGRVGEAAPLGSLGRAVWAATAEPAAPANLQTALRLLCNCFVQPSLLAWVHANGSALLDRCGAAALAAAGASKAVRQGAASLLVNLAVMLGGVAQDELAFKSRMLRLAVDLLKATPPDDQEAIYRTLLAVGTLVPGHSKVRAAAREAGLLEHTRAAGAAGGPKVAALAAELEHQLRL